MDRFSQEDSDLIASLADLSSRSPKLVRSSEYAAPADETIKVRSWRMNEFKYYDVPSPFPTLARGIFSVELPPGENGEKRYRIVARGYDKFFNIGEVPWTTWESLAAHTSPPYTLSLKSNGCIIFIAALTPEKLLITSKHSLGPVAGSELSHAQAGERWLRRYLDAKGKTEADLASTLWMENWTAIAELCDDSFEEHVLPYSPQLTGLHLHGLNSIGKAFLTMPQATVDAFASEWGFIRTRSIVLDSVAAVREFTEKVGKIGTWDGEAVEGFVVRSVVGDSPPATEQAEKAMGKRKGTGPVRSPYAPGSSFFFKVKFDEPYMMYRDWREITKMLISALTKSPAKGKGKGKATDVTPKSALASLPNSKMRRPETKRYAQWVCEQISEDLKRNNGTLGLFADFGKGKGIIRTREMFLEWAAKEGPVSAPTQDEVEISKANKEWGKTIIVPIAIPGSGKTAVSVALQHLFGFGHTQSDDVRAKKSAPVFVKNVVSLLAEHNVVIADKNNHLKQHREALREATQHMTPPVRLLALNWNHLLFPSSATPSLPLPAVHHLATDRILSRGGAHQTLIPDRTAARAHEDVVWMFMEKAEELGSGECDEEIPMYISDDLDQGVRRAVDGVCRILGLEKPSEEKITESIERAKAYVPGTTKTVEDGDSKGSKKGKKNELRYYAVLPEIDLLSVVGGRFERPGTDAAISKFWEHLRTKNRVTKRPHITVVHRNSLPESQPLWGACAALDAYALSQDGKATTQLEARFGHVVWDGRVMALTVDDLRVRSGGDEDSEGTKVAKSLLENIPEDVRRMLHVTVGTKDSTVSPFEAKAMVESWRKGETAPGRNPQIHSLSLVEGAGEGQGIVVFGRLRGMQH